MIEGDGRGLTFPREIRKLSVGTRRRPAIPPMKNDSLRLLSRRPMTSALVLFLAVAYASGSDRASAAEPARTGEQVYRQLYQRTGPSVGLEVINWRLVVSGPKPELKQSHPLAAHKPNPLPLRPGLAQPAARKCPPTSPSAATAAAHVKRKT